MGFTERFLGLETRRLDRKLENILAALARHGNDPDLDMVREAYETARTIHADQRRKVSNDAFVIHPLDVALACATHRMDAVSVTAAILHDCIEDAEPALGLDRRALAARFGDEVATIVEGLTKLRAENVAGDEDAKAETLKKLLTTTATEDVRTIVIKIFDRVDNIRTVDVFAPEKQVAIARETVQFYVPLAARLGFFKQAREMEDHVMRVLQPDVYRAVTRWLGSNERRVDRAVDRVVRDIRATLEGMGIHLDSKLYHKGIYTIFSELQARRLPLARIDEGCNFNLRLIVDDIDACFRTLNLVHRRFVHLPARVRDFINNPKVNGYQSLHTIVTGPDIPKIQVLIRTHEMEVANHLGIISQLRRGRPGDTEWLDDLVDTLAAIDSDPDAVLSVTSRVFYPEIDVLTPAGDARKLPEGATALDFAYAIHTEVGDRALAAEIDGQTRPLRTALGSGNRVKIVTSDQVRPSYERIGWVTTTRAQVALRRSLQRLEREAIAAETTRLLQFLQRKLGVVLRPDMPEFQALLASLLLQSEWDLGKALYTGRLHVDHVVPHAIEMAPSLSTATVIKLLSREGILSGEEAAAIRSVAEEERRRILLADAVRAYLDRRGPGDVNVTIQGMMHAIPVRLAGCCRPDFGDDIVAYVSRERGAAIHRRTCRSIRYPLAYRSAHVVEARWKGPPRLRRVRVELAGHDRRGLLLNISHVFAELKIDAQAVQLDASVDGEARGFALLEVTELTNLDDVAQRIEAIPGITAVTVREGS